MPTRPERTAWISYLRVSTPEQAERELSLPAQRRAIAEYATRHDAAIAREYVEAGCSGMSPRRPAFRRMIEDALRPASDVGAIVVHHTSRFTRDAIEARVVKAKLRRLGVRVLSVCQELTDDPMGKLMEGLFECIDQYESELNGVRTSAAQQEAIRQGYFPGGRAPYGYRTRAVEVRPGVVRHVLEPDPPRPSRCASSTACTLCPAVRRRWPENSTDAA
jgi:site-specific DNA recombinase